MQCFRYFADRIIIVVIQNNCRFIFGREALTTCFYNIKLRIIFCFNKIRIFRFFESKYSCSFDDLSISLHLFCVTLISHAFSWFSSLKRGCIVHQPYENLLQRHLQHHMNFQNIKSNFVKHFAVFIILSFKLAFSCSLSI